jgi:hypothetical protein
MKRLLVLILVWTLLVVTGTIVSADGQTVGRKKSAQPSVRAALPYMHSIAKVTS